MAGISKGINYDEWINRENELSHEFRKDRLKWLAELPFYDGYFAFHGSKLHYLMYEEARYSFIMGSDLSAVLLSMSVIEWALTSIFRMPNQQELEKANFEKKINGAIDAKIIPDEFHKRIHELREIRNRIVHFSLFLRHTTIESRSIANELDYLTIMEKDAKDAIILMFIVLCNSPFSTSTVTNEKLDSLKNHTPPLSYFTDDA